MGVQNSIIGFICCCGALEDAFDYSNYERVVDNQGLHEPLVSTAENGFLAEDDPPQKKKELKLNNILGFGMRDVHKDYEIGELLGEGAFGVVTRCRNRATGEVFACKKIEKRQMKRKADVEDIRREVQILMVCTVCIFLACNLCIKLISQVHLNAATKFSPVRGCSVQSLRGR